MLLRFRQLIENYLYKYNNNNNMTIEKQMKCKKCKYKWITKSELIMISCPSCGAKNKITDI